jgi:phenylacetate-CoA ligase
MVQLGDRTYPTHYIQDLLDRLGGIDEFQLEQTTPATLTLKLVLHEGVDPAPIRQRVTSWWGQHVAVEFVGFDDLTRQGWRAKFRHLVSQSDSSVRGDRAEDASSTTSSS